MPKQQEDNSRYNLVTGEDTYSGQFAQNPTTARRLQSLIPSVSGELVRELGDNLYLPTNIGGKVGALFEYDYNDATGNNHAVRFAATSTTLWKQAVGGVVWTQVSLPTPSGVLSLTPFTDYPQFVNINNLLHFSDGTTNWIYDGPNNAFVIDGFPIPENAPDFLNTVGGTLSSTIAIYYWFTYSDQTSGRVHESSSSLISANAGPITNKQVQVFPGGLSTGINTSNVSQTVTTTQPFFVSENVGMHLWVIGIDYGPIISVTNPNQAVLQSVAPSNNTGTFFIVAPPRATNINVYRSEIDGSKLGQFLATIPIAGNFFPYLIDQSPFTNQPNTTMLNIDRPIRNDPAPISKVLEVHKYRIFRRRENIPNRFNYTANEEVASGTNGSPQESVPGADINTLSDIINETAYPRPAAAIRAFKSHADALYIGTEKEIIPLWGDTIGAFALSEVTAIDGGVISRWGMETLSHGLSIFSYDRKLYIYPPISPIWALTPQDINVTDQLIEIGRAMRNKFLTILGSDIQNVRTLKYRYNTRDWLVICYQDKTNIYHTYIYDFETKGWFELQRGFVSLAVFEVSPGIKVLVGGGVDGLVYVADDVTGAFGSTATLPNALFRTSLMDFGQPTSLHEPDYLEIEVNNPALMNSSTTINFYIDPLDADNPGTPIALPMAPVPGTPLLYRGFFSTAGGLTGVVCKRFMVEINVVSDTNAGAFRSISIKSDPIANLIR